MLNRWHDDMVPSVDRDEPLAEALRRLDARLLSVVDEEEHRAHTLTAEGADGWDGVRNLIRPSVARLRPTAGQWDPLVPVMPSPLRTLSDGLWLEDVELEAVLVALAPHVEPRYSAVYGLLQDDVRQPLATERLLYAVLGRDPVRMATLAESLGPAGRLTRSGVLTQVHKQAAPLARAFDLPADVVAALLGGARPPVTGAAGQRWVAGTGAGPTSAVTVVHGTGDRVERALALVDGIGVVVRPGSATAEAVRSAWRVGLLAGAVPVIDLGACEDPAPIVAEAVELVTDLGGRAILLTREPLPIAAAHVEATAPTWAERRAAWLWATDGTLSEADAGRLAARHRIGAAGIRQIVGRAVSRDVDELDSAAAGSGVEAVRHSQRVVPGRSLDDLILRDTTRDAVERLIYYVAHRDEAGEALGLSSRFPVATGPVVLFAGRSGTGKTAAAEAVAAAVGRPLHTVDLAQLMSKYVGETEKHIDEVFTQSQRTSAVLLFDEADTLFSARVEQASNAGEQFGNMLVGYLLQRIERHDGLTILATNLRGGIDEAFLRRFQFRIEFPLPADDERIRIWDLMLPPKVARADDVDFAALAKAHRFTGGDIRNAALRAIFLAHRRGEPVRQADLERAVELELLEMGRLSRHDAGAEADRGQLMRRTLDALEDVLGSALRARFRNEIHVVHGAPTPDNVGARRPAVSMALFRLAARRGNAGLRTGFIVSAWSHRPEEESELLGVVHEVLSEATLPAVHGRQTHLRIAESHDFDLLNRFWSSHGQAVRPSLVVDVEID
ncbi:AAA family ATPase [Mycolicibacterium mageritense]|uniref:ATP-dependent zinc metalloprotease FtsH n=1 Tax=Mycolicibacterium mageritense TaxID=53462 RepID=A0AAI8XQH4_MYCME|nr:AAA family ATPase [Mycolicibacterium mageritense]BDY31017.1 ATP-dependent zinc metalloprotease FtsH [Mycolicibacterium mageritense]